MDSAILEYMVILTRRTLRRLCRILIGAMLYGQMAVAAYACLGPAARAGQPQGFVPVAMQADVAASGDAAGAPMPGCHDMGDAPAPKVSKLCTEHCQFGQQGNQAPTLVVPDVLLTPLYLASPAPELSTPAPTAVFDAVELAAASPPHAILHCCFRI
jgi:hypothetical protein